MTVQVTTPQGPIRGSAGDLTATGVEVIPQGPPGDVGTGGAVSSVNSRTGAVVLTSADVGLANVNNTSDANKPVSTAQAAADAAVLASANATTAAHAARTDNPHTVTAAQLGLGNVENKSSATIRSEITSGNVTTALGYTPENAAQKGTAGGYAPLDGTGKVASTYLPSTDAVPEGASNLYFTAARVLATVLSGLSTATNAVITASDTVLSALGKLQKQISDNLTTLTGHTSNTSNPHSTTAAQVGAVPTSRTVNGQALSADVVVTTITGNAGTASALQTARTINGVAFDGSANITINATDSTARVAKAGDTMTGALNWATTQTIASAATTDIGAATSNSVIVSGTTTITALGTIAAGAERVVQFSGALTLTHNATSLILPGGASITTAAGDVAYFVSLGAGNWRCTGYQKASGQPVVASGASMDSAALAAARQLANSNFGGL